MESNKKVKLNEGRDHDITFNELVLQNHQRIYGLFRRMVSNHEEADDLTQDTFIKVYKKLAAFKHQSSLSTWIYRIAVNTGLNHLRKMKSRQFIGLDNVANIKDPDNSNNSREQRVILNKAIAKLPSKQQMVVLLRSFQELPFKEIAAIMDSTENAAKVNFSHAIVRLKSILENMGFSYETV